jgi:diadenosine tetraphosphate (Ap4A) HIT family hydrolase
LDRTTDHVWNTILAETENFFVVPTMGALVPGWVLIIPRAHQLNIGCLTMSHRAELRTLVERFTVELSREFGPVTLFEHGPSVEGTEVGCGVDHAHLHLVSLPFSMQHAVADFREVPLPWMKVMRGDGLPPCDLVAPYYWYRDQSGSEFSSSAPSGISQLFRRIIAGFVRRPSQFDYRHFPNQGNAAETVRVLNPKMRRTGAQEPISAAQ